MTRQGRQSQEMTFFGRSSKSLKAVSSFSTSKFLRPPETCLPRGWCCERGLEPPLLTWEEAEEQAWPFVWVPRNPQVQRWSSPIHQGGQPQRAWGQGAGDKECCLTSHLFCVSAKDHESCLASVVVKSTWLWSWPAGSKSWTPLPAGSSLNSGLQ